MPGTAFPNFDQLRPVALLLRGRRILRAPLRRDDVVGGRCHNPLGHAKREHLEAGTSSRNWNRREPRAGSSPCRRWQPPTRRSVTPESDTTPRTASFRWAAAQSASCPPAECPASTTRPRSSVASAAIVFQMIHAGQHIVERRRPASALRIHAPVFQAPCRVAVLRQPIRPDARCCRGRCSGASSRRGSAPQPGMGRRPWGRGGRRTGRGPRRRRSFGLPAALEFSVPRPTAESALRSCSLSVSPVARSFSFFAAEIPHSL